MKIKKTSLVIISIALVTNFIFVNSDVLGANSKASYNILDYVYEDIIPGKSVLTFTLNDSDAMINSQYVKSELNKVGITVINNLPDTICTGTEIKTNYNNKTFTALIYGDVNADGQVDSFDAQDVLLHDVFGGNKEIKGINYAAGNVLNSDTDLDTFDAQRMMLFSVGYINNLVEINKPLNTDTVKPIISLNGNSKITIEVGSTYKDEGVTALDNKDGNITSKVTTVNPVDTTKLGEYTIKYNVSDLRGNKATEVTRKVIVVDTTAPVISLKGNNEIRIEAGSTYIDEGVTVSDNYDKDINSKLSVINPVGTTKLGEYTVTYNVKDSNNNIATEVTRKVIVVDTTAPVIELNGNGEITIPTGIAYIDLKAKVKDNYDSEREIEGIIYKNGTEVNDIDVSVLGDYVIKYNTVDSNSNIADEVERIVHVRKAIQFIDYSNNIQSKEVYTNSNDILLNTIKVDVDEVPYKITDLKAYITLDGKEISSDSIEIKFVKSGSNINIYCNTKNEVGDISVIPYFGDKYSLNSIQGNTLPIRVISNVTSVKIDNVDNNSSLKKINFLNDGKSVDVLSNEILINPSEAELLSMKDGQIAIKTTGNFTISKKTVDDNNIIIDSSSPKSKIKYIEIVWADNNEPEGTIEILVANNSGSTVTIDVEKSILKDIKLPYKNISVSALDVEDITPQKVQNREVIKKSVGSKVYTLIPIEFYKNSTDRYDNMLVENVNIKQGNFTSGLIANKLTFASSKTIKSGLKLFTVVGDDVLDVTGNAGSKFDYIGFLFNGEIIDTDITISFGDITDSNQVGYVQSQTFKVN